MGGIFATFVISLPSSISFSFWGQVIWRLNCPLSLVFCTLLYTSFVFVIQPEELGMAENFHPGEGQFARRIVHSYVPDFYSSVITFGMGPGMMPWVESTVEVRMKGQ